MRDANRFSKYEEIQKDFHNKKRFTQIKKFSQKKRFS